MDTVWVLIPALTAWANVEGEPPTIYFETEAACEAARVELVEVSKDWKRSVCVGGAVLPIILK